MTSPTNTEFELRGFNHVALVCSDMQRTVDFYSGILGMPLIKTVALPDGIGQHFFFDAGNGNSLAFFWFADNHDAVPGISSPITLPGFGEWTSSVSSLNHVAFDVPADKFVEYRNRLKEKGIRVGPLVNHDDSETQVAETMHPGVYVRSFYFQDPDDILLEFSCWLREFTPDDVCHVPRTGAERVARVF
ncbi:VOC family protein [Nocardiaceae bacterium NPDC056970]|uniref:VOC family protein n=1 Tax=Rhodococcus sp. ACT016 TaxID=3134808 RepID=UPI003644D799